MGKELLFDFNFVRDNLYLLVRREGHGYSCKRVEGTNLAFGLYVTFESDSHNMIFNLKKPVVEWGKTEEELYEIAKRNTMQGFKCMPMWRVLEKFMNPEDFERSDCVNSYDRTSLVVSNASGRFGASTVFIPEVARQITDSAITIIPCSIHECIVLLGNQYEDREQLGSMIKSVNHTVLNQADVLSDIPYFYDSTLGYFM